MQGFKGCKGSGSRVQVEKENLTMLGLKGGWDS